MTRRTSAIAFKEINESGLLTKRKLQIYNLLYKHGPSTAGEIFTHGINDGIWKRTVKGGVCARLTELSRSKCVQEKGEKVCPTSNKKAILWEVSGKLPIELPKQKPKKEIKKEALDIIKKDLRQIRKLSGGDPVVASLTKNLASNVALLV